MSDLIAALCVLALLGGGGLALMAWPFVLRPVGDDLDEHDWLREPPPWPLARGEPGAGHGGARLNADRGMHSVHSLNSVLGEDAQ